MRCLPMVSASAGTVAVIRENLKLWAKLERLDVQIFRGASGLGAVQLHWLPLLKATRFQALNGARFALFPFASTFGFRADFALLLLLADIRQHHVQAVHVLKRGLS